MTHLRARTAFLAAGVAIAVAVAAGLIASHVGSGPDLRLFASDDTYALGTDPLRASGTDARLVAGAGGGFVAITFLKFRVPTLPGGIAPKRAEVRLTRTGGPLPPHVELTYVPSNRWGEATLTSAGAPRLGKVLGTARPDPLDGTLTFDVTQIVQATGTFSFAVTAPAGDGLATFIAKEADRTRARLLQPSLWLSAAGRPQPNDLTVRPSATPPGRPYPVDLPSVSPSVTDPPSTDLPPTVLPSTEAPPTDVPPTDLPPTDVPPTDIPPTDLPPTDLPPTTLPPTTLPPTAMPSPTEPEPTEPEPTEPPEPECAVGERLVPTCGALWGVAPGAHTTQPRIDALRDFEQKTGRPQAVYHAYHRGTELFPTAAEIEVARQTVSRRILFLNWKPLAASWASVADGDLDTYLDRLARHIRENFPEPFFFTIHHEPENDVRPVAGSGWTAHDYAAMFRHVVERLRANGVTNLVTVMAYMAYVPWNTKSWFEELYPGDDVVDWVAWDTYAYSEPGYGYGDFAEMMNRRSSSRPAWPGFYNWAAFRFPDKPLMVAEWGVWHSHANIEHSPWFYDTVGQQIQLFPRVKAMVYFDTPHNQQGWDSRVDVTPESLEAYRRLGLARTFQVAMD